MPIYTILLVLAEGADAAPWAAFAQRLCPADHEPHVVLRTMITIPEDASLSAGARVAQAERDRLTTLAVALPEVDDDVRAYVDHQPLLAACEEVRALDADLLIVQWNGPLTETGGLPTEEVLRYAACDLLLVSALPAEPAPVLLSLRGGPNLSLSLRAAHALCGSAGITLFHATDQSAELPPLNLVQQSDPRITRVVSARQAIAEGIAHEAGAHGAVILGASFRPYDAPPGDEPVANRVARATDRPLILARAFYQESFTFHTPEARPSVDDPSRRIDRWFAENTFHSHEFSDTRALLELKHKRGVTISLGLPALNEEETIETVIRTLKDALVEEVPLIDEIVVIDSNSTDKTVAIAEALGIPVYRHPEILPEVGARVGKGEALWKSLHVLRGDIIAWVDTDIVNIHPRFVYGLLGPLLKYPHVQFVKGFYQRPIRTGDTLQSSGGGRVTELVARPMFNLFYPELSGLVQPLAGEYAGRREALEQVPFFTGYGVETGLLIDLLRVCGLDAIAQVDLETRVHHNQPLEGLSRMAFAILQVFMGRLGERAQIDLLELANPNLKLVVQEPESISLEERAIQDEERPPMLSIPAYVERRATLLQPNR